MERQGDRSQISRSGRCGAAARTPHRGGARLCGVAVGRRRVDDVGCGQRAPFGRAQLRHAAHGARRTADPGDRLAARRRCGTAHPADPGHSGRSGDAGKTGRKRRKGSAGADAGAGVSLRRQRQTEFHQRRLSGARDRQRPGTSAAGGAGGAGCLRPRRIRAAGLSRRLFQSAQRGSESRGRRAAASERDHRRAGDADCYFRCQSRAGAIEPGLCGAVADRSALAGNRDRRARHSRQAAHRRHAAGRARLSGVARQASDLLPAQGAARERSVASAGRTHRSGDRRPRRSQGRSDLCVRRHHRPAQAQEPAQDADGRAAFDAECAQRRRRGVRHQWPADALATRGCRRCGRCRSTCSRPIRISTRSSRR